MALIRWSTDLSVGVGELDKQHQRLIEMINQLHEAMRAGKGLSVIQTTLDGMIAYTREHFATEEALFSKHGYPEAEVHRKAHQQFVHKVGEFRDRLLTSKIGLSLDVMNFLVDWLKNHIKGDDRRYGPFLNECGVS